MVTSTITIPLASLPIVIFGKFNHVATVHAVFYAVESTVERLFNGGNSSRFFLFGVEEMNGAHGSDVYIKRALGSEETNRIALYTLKLARDKRSIFHNERMQHRRHRHGLWRCREEKVVEQRYFEHGPR
jgi:hypothetical protein